jgi:phage shock protein PspC (stress-responsive transcriptional regulator)
LHLDRRRLVRREHGRLVAGVAAGIGDTLGVAANVVRCGFLVLTLAGGLGVVLYGAGWLLMRSGDPDLPRRRTDAISTVAFSAIVLGLLILVRVVGLTPGDVILWPLAIAMIGSRSCRCARARRRPSHPTGRSSSTCPPKPRKRSACCSGRDAARWRG